MALRVLLCASEVVPFAKTGGLADVIGALPKALAALGHDARVAMPNYASIDARAAKPKKVGKPFDVPLGRESVPVSVSASEAIPGVTVYLIDCPQYFGRKGLYGEPDDDRRFALFCRGVLEFLRHDKWRPDVIHANDWQAGLIPVYLRNTYADDEALSSIATVYTVHNLAYQGRFGPEALDEIGLPRSLLTPDGIEFYGQVNFLKGGLIFADVLNTVSEAYSHEIQTPEFGEMLEGVLAQRRSDLFGILNGLDYDAWDPATDALIAANFDAGNLAPKTKNKAALQQQLGLPTRPDVPLFGLVSRLAGQKGLDILAEALPHLLELDVQFALLGTGERIYEDLLADLARTYPDKMKAALEFDNALAHLIYAGSDFFLMPSRYEPCGLGQMISLRYGTIPIVRHTGGLADTIVDFNSDPENGNGFSFRQHSAVGLFGAMARALLTMKVVPSWERLIRNAVASDFSWERSAKAYVGLYEKAAQRRRSG